MQLANLIVGTAWIGAVIACAIAFFLIWGIFMLVLTPAQRDAAAERGALPFSARSRRAPLHRGPHTPEDAPDQDFIGERRTGT